MLVILFLFLPLLLIRTVLEGRSQVMQNKQVGHIVDRQDG